MVQRATKSGKTQGERDIMRVLFVPILIAVFALSITLHEGLASFPPTPQPKPFLPAGTFENGITTKSFSTPGNPSYKTFFWHTEKKCPVSAWHDISLKSKNMYNYIVEIPRGTHPKLEIQPKQYLNPIVQDRFKDGSLRFVFDPYPYHYGAFPQTWENPFAADPWTGIVGDKDPLDILDLGTGVYSPGDVVTVKILGVLALLGHGDETDWKVIAVDIKDPLAEKYNDVSELTLEEKIDIITFFKFYKVPDGELPNVYAFDEQFLNHTFAAEVIENKHQEWKQLVRGEVKHEGVKEFHAGCVICPEPGTKKEFKINEADARKWAEKEVSDFLNN